MDNKEYIKDNSVKIASIWDWVRGICIILFVLFILFKLYNSTISIDFSTLLSIVLAIFSIWLSATFYFKATETSNRFYENTYRHSKDIATLLAKIESGFGEKLNSLYDNYSNIKTIIQNPSDKDREQLESQINELQERSKKIEDSKNKIIKDLISKSNMQEKEKERITKDLKSKEKLLKESNQKISNLETKAISLKDEDPGNRILSRIKRYLRLEVIPKILSITENTDMNDLSDYELIKVFNKCRNDFPSSFLIEFRDSGFMSLANNLNDQGIYLIRYLSKSA